MEMERNHGYWIHEKVSNEQSVTGYIYKRECTCSECGNEVNMEKKVCPYCGAIMGRNPKN